MKIAVRHVQFVILFFTIVIFLVHRTSLSVAIIAMTTEEFQGQQTNIPSYPQWDNIDTILSSFYWGYILSQVGAGQLGEYFGPKWFLFGAMVLSSISNLLLPTMASRWGSTGVIISRIMQGLNQGFLFPSVNNLISRWTPLGERSTVTGIICGAAAIGNVIALVLTGIICESKLGWPVSFYLNGGVGLSWAIIFAIVASNSPSTHGRITSEEKSYIESNNGISRDRKKVPTPWKSIITSLPIWAVLVFACGESWGYSTLLTELPIYMRNVMAFDVVSDSELSALPYLVYFFISLLSGQIADKLISKKIFSVGTTRNVFNLLGSMLPAAALFTLGFIHTNKNISIIVILILSVGASGFSNSGNLINVIDLAPNHAGTIHGIVNTVGTISSILGPLTVGFFGADKSDLNVWRNVFWLAAGMYVCSGLFYAIFSSGELQPWNDIEQKKEEEPENDNVRE